MRTLNDSGTRIHALYVPRVMGRLTVFQGLKYRSRKPESCYTTSACPRPSRQMHQLLRVGLPFAPNTALYFKSCRRYTRRPPLHKLSSAAAPDLGPTTTKTALRKLPKQRLEEELRDRGLATSGTKTELIERLMGELQGEGEGEGGGNQHEDQRVLQDIVTAAPEEVMTSSKATEEGSGVNSLQDIMSWNKPKIQSCLAARGLSKTGRKDVLAQRLMEAMQQEMAAEEVPQEGTGVQLRTVPSTVDDQLTIEDTSFESTLDTYDAQEPEDALDVESTDLDEDFEKVSIAGARHKAPITTSPSDAKEDLFEFDGSSRQLYEKWCKVNDDIPEPDQLRREVPPWGEFRDLGFPGTRPITDTASVPAAGKGKDDVTPVAADEDNVLLDAPSEEEESDEDEPGIDDLAAELDETGEDMLEAMEKQLGIFSSGESGRRREPPTSLRPAPHVPDADADITSTLVVASSAAAKRQRSSSQAYDSKKVDHRSQRLLLEQRLRGTGTPVEGTVEAPESTSAPGPPKMAVSVDDEDTATTSRPEAKPEATAELPPKESDLEAAEKGGEKEGMQETVGLVDLLQDLKSLKTTNGNAGEAAPAVPVRSPEPVSKTEAYSDSERDVNAAPAVPVRSPEPVSETEADSDSEVDEALEGDASALEDNDGSDTSDDEVTVMTKHKDRVVVDAPAVPVRGPDEDSESESEELLDSSDDRSLGWNEYSAEALETMDPIVDRDLHVKEYDEEKDGRAEDVGGTVVGGEGSSVQVDIITGQPSVAVGPQPPLGKTPERPKEFAIEIITGQAAIVTEEAAKKMGDYADVLLAQYSAPLMDLDVEEWGAVSLSQQEEGGSGTAVQGQAEVQATGPTVSSEEPIDSIVSTILSAASDDDKAEQLVAAVEQIVKRGQSSAESTTAPDSSASVDPELAKAAAAIIFSSVSEEKAEELVAAVAEAVGSARGSDAEGHGRTDGTAAGKQGDVNFGRTDGTAAGKQGDVKFGFAGGEGEVTFKGGAQPVVDVSSARDVAFEVQSTKETGKHEVDAVADAVASSSFEPTAQPGTRSTTEAEDLGRTEAAVVERAAAVQSEAAATEFEDTSEPARVPVSDPQAAEQAVAEPTSGPVPALEIVAEPVAAPGAAVRGPEPVAVVAETVVETGSKIEESKTEVSNTEESKPVVAEAMVEPGSTIEESKTEVSKTEESKPVVAEAMLEPGSTIEESKTEVSKTEESKAEDSKPEESSAAVAEASRVDAAPEVKKSNDESNGETTTTSERGSSPSGGTALGLSPVADASTAPAEEAAKEAENAAVVAKVTAAAEALEQQVVEKLQVQVVKKAASVEELEEKLDNAQKLYASNRKLICELEAEISRMNDTKVQWARMLSSEGSTTYEEAKAKLESKLGAKANLEALLSGLLEEINQMEENLGSKAEKRTELLQKINQLRSTLDSATLGAESAASSDHDSATTSSSKPPYLNGSASRGQPKLDVTSLEQPERKAEQLTSQTQRVAEAAEKLPVAKAEGKAKEKAGMPEVIGLVFAAATMSILMLGEKLVQAANDLAKGTQQKKQAQKDAWDGKEGKDENCTSKS